MNLTQKIFEKHVSEFEKRALNELGYHLRSDDVPKLNLASNILAYHFYRDAGKLMISMFASDFEDGRKAISFSMISDELRIFRRHFSLQEYIRDHGITDLREVCRSDEDFETFTIEYFTHLERAFGTYLRDQVTGVNFEGHNALGK